MKTKTLLVVAFIAGLIGTSGAATITLARGVGNPGVSTGLEDGGWAIQVGSYTVDPVVGTEAATLISLFNVFGSGVSPTTGATKGLITGSFTGVGGGNPDLFNLKTIYVMVGNKPTIAESDAWGVFYFKSASNFPSDVTKTGTTIVSIPNSQSFTPILGDVAANGNFVLVPEPATALLGAMGVLGLLRRRR